MNTPDDYRDEYDRYTDYDAPEETRTLNEILADL